jgi:DNA topoisomerase-2
MASLVELSDEDIAEPIDDSEDEAPVEKKTGGRKPAAEKPKATTVRKRGPAPSKGMKQKVLDEALKPDDDSNASAPSPEKKVRKMRPSPFNKKSSSILQRVGSASTSTEDADAPPSGSSAEPVVAPRRIVRERKPMASYTVDSESDDNDSDDEDVVDVSDDSDYSDDD